MRLLPLITLIAFALPAGAQQNPTLDSAAVQLIARTATGYLNRIPSDTTRRPWKLTLPAQDSALWQPVRAKLMDAVRGREPVDSDSIRWIVTIAHVYVSADTLHATITIGDEHRCGGRWRGWGETHLLIALWGGTRWANKMQSVGEIVGDSVPCQTLRTGAP